MTERVDEREADAFLLNIPRKLFDPFPDLLYFRENHPVFFYEPFDQWFVFGYDDVAGLFHNPTLSAYRMKGFVDAAPSWPKRRHASLSKPCSGGCPT
jgi:cytochrome P450